MAITWLDTDVVFGSSPTWKRSIGYEETSRTASSVTYTITLKLKVQGSGTSSSFYGYPVSWSIDGGTATQIKDSTRWYGNEGYRTFTKSITKSVGASGGTTSMSVKIYATGGGSMSQTISHSLKYSTFNTAPYWSSSARLRVRENDANGYLVAEERSGTENSFKAREDVSKYYIYWDSASDNENNISKYELYTQINDGSWSLIYSGSNRYYTHNVGSGNQGYKYDYYVVAVDSYGAKSPSLDTTQFQKNALTGANLTISNGIWYATESMKLTWSGASNTNGHSSFTYSVSSSGLTIYNKEKLTASGGTIKILKSGTSTDPYILFEDVKKYVASSSTKTGQFNISLTTKNAYGSTVTKTATALIDARTNPKAPTTVSIGGKVSTSLGNYLIPSRSNAVISWSGASDYLGGTLSYDVYYKVGSGSEVLISAGTSTSASIKLPTPTSATTVAFRVVAKTTYGNSSSSSTVSDTIHFYNPPTVSISGYNRTISNASLTITNAVNSSIPNIAFSKQSYTGNGTTANYTGAKYTATISGLNESSAFTFTATVNDNTGLSSDVSASFKVTPATPKLSVREKGVGIDCIASSGNALEVQGRTQLNGNLRMKSPAGSYTRDIIRTYEGNEYGLGLAIDSGGSTLIGGGESCQNYIDLITDKSVENLYLLADNGITFASNCNTIANRIEATLNNGLLTVNTNSASSNKGVKILGTAGKALNLWVGTGGGVLQTLDDYNLHLGRNGSTTDMVFYSDRIETKKERVAYGSITHDINAGERRVAFGSGTTRYWGMYGNNNGLGWYDWKNSRSVMSYTPSTGDIEAYQTMYLSGMPSTSNGRHLTVNTAHDSNGYGDGKTHIGYRTTAGYNHYFRGTGTMNINCTGGTSISKTLTVGDTVIIGNISDTAWHGYETRRTVEGAGYISKMGTSNAYIQLTSSTTAYYSPATLLTLENSSASALRRLELTPVSLQETGDNRTYLGTSARRWQAVYASTGTVYSSSKDEKFDIVPLNNGVRTASLNKSTDEVIVDGIKNMNFYSYKYKTLAEAGEGSSNMFVGFLGQEVEASDPEFFSLFGSSYDKVVEPPTEEVVDGEDQPTILPLADKEVKTVKQYDIREASLNGVLMVGLQQALLKIDILEQEIRNLKKGGM